MPRRNARKWYEIISNHKDSGMSIAQFCRQQGLSQTNFYKWRKKLAQDKDRPFLEIQLNHVTTPTPCEIVLPDCRVVVPPGFDPDSLRALLDVLRQEKDPC